MCQKPWGLRTLTPLIRVCSNQLFILIQPGPLSYCGPKCTAILHTTHLCMCIYLLATQPAHVGYISLTTNLFLSFICQNVTIMQFNPSRCAFLINHGVHNLLEENICCIEFGLHGVKIFAVVIHFFAETGGLMMSGLKLRTILFNFGIKD